MAWRGVHAWAHLACVRGRHLCTWQDVDHDVYVFGLPQLAGSKRKLAQDGVIALFLGFGQYRVRALP